VRNGQTDQAKRPGSLGSARSSRRSDSLVAAALDIGRVLADRDGVTFRAVGACMYPVVRPGDVLRIRSCAATDAWATRLACRR